MSQEKKMGDAAGSGPRSPEYSSLADARSGVLPPIAIAPAPEPPCYCNLCGGPTTEAQWNKRGACEECAENLRDNG